MDPLDLRFIGNEDMDALRIWVAFRSLEGQTLHKTLPHIRRATKTARQHEISLCHCQR